ncbi:hypothetical protein LX99_00887 [Mucilaginibacter oryzae]|uniref:Uncharacterized protein n=1 Tax=Mucilaginibacter oryzae TaxID=468058 RepID=A0A316HK80_9SPHI|nr:hypothetical protein [Mucilaginibacter oryzae]PWK80421.1 hypothetical protein LX99_00887 [Mucilaginibacter oryzae]
MRNNEKKLTKAYRFKVKAKKLKTVQTYLSANTDSPLAACIQGGVSFALNIPICHGKDVLEVD